MFATEKQGGFTPLKRRLFVGKRLQNEGLLMSIGVLHARLFDEQPVNLPGNHTDSFKHG
jgi:hypothetical protein